MKYIIDDKYLIFDEIIKYYFSKQEFKIAKFVEDFNNNSNDYILFLKEIFAFTNDPYEIFFRLKNKYFDKPICPTCKKNYLKFIKSKNRFQHHCCHSCAAKDPLTLTKVKETNLTNFGCEYVGQSEQVKDKIRKTNLEKYDCEYALQAEEIREKSKLTKLEKYGNEIYNNPDQTTATCRIRYGSGRNSTKIENTMQERYGIKSYLSSKEISDMRNNSEIQNKIQATKRKNHTFNSSSAEKICYQMLIDKFGNNDVKLQYKSKLYPFNCDFYIISKDLYIEYNGSWTHGKHAFDANNKNDLLIVEKWKEKSKTKDYYNKAIDTWTIRDVNKRSIAIMNNLNYKEFWTIDNLENYLNKI